MLIIIMIVIEAVTPRRCNFVMILFKNLLSLRLYFVSLVLNMSNNGLVRLTNFLTPECSPEHHKRNETDFPLWNRSKDSVLTAFIKSVIKFDVFSSFVYN